MRAVLAIAVLLVVAGGISAQNDTQNGTVNVVVGVGPGSSRTLTPQTAKTLEPKIELATQRVLQYQWNTTVAAEPKSLTVRFDQQKQVDYTTTFTRTIQSNDITLNGTITITNTNSFAVVIYGVRVQITSDRSGRRTFVEAQCQDGDNDGSTITFGPQLLGAPASAKQVVCTFEVSPNEASGRVQVQYALTRAGRYEYIARGPVPFDTRNAPLVRTNECALVFDSFATGVPTASGAPRLTAVQPNELRQRRNGLVSNNLNAAQICQTTRFTFIAVVGPFANDACGEKQLYYSAFAFPVSFRAQRTSSWDESGAYDIARISTPVTVQGCRPTTQPATVRIESAVAQYVTVDSYRIVRDLFGLSSNKPTTVVVDYRRGGRLDVVTAVRRTPGAIIERRIVGNVVVASGSGNPDYAGQVQVFVQQGRRISATVTCPGGGSQVTVRPGAQVTCRYEAVVASESAAIVQAVFSPRNFPREQSPRVIVLSFRNAQRISADPCYNVSETAQVLVVNPRSNPAPTLIVSGNRPPTRPTRVCTPTTYRYRFTIPRFRFNQCGRYQLVLNARVAPISTVEGIVIGTATQRQVINVDVVGCPSFTPVRLGINPGIAGLNVAQTLLSGLAERRD